MKIKAPDCVDVDNENEINQETLPKNGNPSFEAKVLDMIKLSHSPSKFVIDDSSPQNPELKHQVVKKIKELCIEEILPRHVKAIEAIESKSDELDCQLRFQQQEILHLVESKQQLEESLDKIEEAWKTAQDKQTELRERVKETLQKLQDCCKNKTIAESKMRLDLIELKAKTDNLKVFLVDTSSKVNYYNSQMKVQTQKVEKITKPFYLDSNKSYFIKSNLSTTNQNIEDLVQRVKILKRKTSELEELDALQDISKLTISKNHSGIV